MARRSKYPPLQVYLNSRQIGTLTKESSGAIYFTYDSEWLNWKHALPVSLSLSLQEERYSGAAVTAVFENLLPDNEQIRSRVAARFQADGTDPFSLLAVIGRDCVGALQFLQGDDKPNPVKQMQGVALTTAEIADTLRSLSKNPLGLNNDRDFRISIAGAQEKTALLKQSDQWILPTGTTPTTHILKTQIGQLSNGLDLIRSVENEFLCLNIVREFGLDTANATIEQFENETVLVVERFDRKKSSDGYWLRIPQEDCCQALSFASTSKYQSDGGPGIQSIMQLLIGSDEPLIDRRAFFKANVLFWLLGATDGHAKNFSLSLMPQGRFRLTPLYDVISLQPSVDDSQVRHSEFKLAMRVGNSRKYNINDIHGRHFLQSGQHSGFSSVEIKTIFDEILDTASDNLSNVADSLAGDFPPDLVKSVFSGIERRLQRLTAL